MTTNKNTPDPCDPKSCGLINQIFPGTPRESWYCTTHKRPYYPTPRATDSTSDQVDAVDEILYKALTSVMPELNQVVYDNAFLGAKAKLNALLLEADDKARLDTMARVLLSVGGELEITRKALTDDINRYVIHQTPTSKLDGGLVYRISDPSEVA